MAAALENIALHERVAREARMDELTGLPNHRHFQESLASELERLRRFRRSLSLIMIDIDAFKAVNDTYGHQRGDEVLRGVAAAIRDGSRATDLAARYGGEELAVVMPETGLDGAFAAGEALRRAVEQLEFPVDDGPPLKVTISLGVASTGSEPVTAAELIAAADDALYAAKRGGRNRTVRAQEPQSAAHDRP
jgi:diguanylate cyclase (GGDEF)-like protein